MLVYEHKRTQEIVNRLTLIANLARSLIILTWVLLFAGLFTIPAATISPSYWWLGSVLGGLVGVILGSISASILVTILEWMAQILVAQGEIVAALKKSSE